jgi:hypothetical protein
VGPCWHHERASGNGDWPSSDVDRERLAEGLTDRAFPAVADRTRRAVLERLGTGGATTSALAEPFA